MGTMHLNGEEWAALDGLRVRGSHVPQTIQERQILNSLFLNGLATLTIDGNSASVFSPLPEAEQALATGFYDAPERPSFDSVELVLKTIDPREGLMLLLQLARELDRRIPAERPLLGKPTPHHGVPPLFLF